MYIFNILPNTVPFVHVKTDAVMFFSIDGEDTGSFFRSPDSSNTILYNQLVYKNLTLSNVPHTLVITASDHSLVLFDYILYTTQAEDTTHTNSSFPSPSFTYSEPRLPSTTPLGAILGAIFGVLSLLLGIGTGLLFLHRRHKRRTSVGSQNSPADESKHESNHDGHEGRRTSDGPGADITFVTQYIASSIAASSPLRSLDEGTMCDPLRSASYIEPPGQDSTPHASIPATSIVTFGSFSVDQTSQSRETVTERLETLQSVRSSVLPSQPVADPILSRSGLAGERGTEAAIRDLEAEIAQLRGVLTAMNARLADGLGGHHTDSEPLPGYAE